MKNLIYKGVDTMKDNKDNVTNQLSDAAIANSSQLIKEIGATHLAHAVPLNSNSEFVANGNTPSPRTSENLYKAWCDIPHSDELGVIHRGTLSEMEGIWNFSQVVGTARIPTGNATSAPTDGTATILGRFHTQVDRIAADGCISSGDILAFCPERTEGIFSDTTAFLPSTAPGLQTRYTNWMGDMKTICDNILSARSITGVITGYTANNWTEVDSGWLQSGVFSTPNIVSYDHYGSGSHLSSDMDTDLADTGNAKNIPLFHQEWGNQETHANDAVYRNYLRGMFDVFTKYSNLADANKRLIGLSIWGGWAGNLESLFTGSPGSYTLNAAGEMLRAYYRYGYYKTSSYMSFAS